MAAQRLDGADSTDGHSHIVCFTFFFFFLSKKQIRESPSTASAVSVQLFSVDNNGHTASFLLCVRRKDIGVNHLVFYASEYGKNTF
jgi:hypothetical protein